jgi:hypothetical protein
VTGGEILIPGKMLLASGLLVAVPALELWLPRRGRRGARPDAVRSGRGAKTGVKS